MKKFFIKIRMKNLFVKILLMVIIVLSSFQTMYGFSLNDNSTIQSRIRNLQIPANLLNKMSTDSLLESCLTYPYFINFLFYDSFEKGVKVLEKEFNGFQELLQRRDLAITLLKKKQSYSKELQDIMNSNTIVIGTWGLQQLLIDYLLSDEKIFLSLSNTQKCFFLSFADSINSLRKKNPHILGAINEIPYKIHRQKTRTSPTPLSIYTPNNSVVPDTYLINEEEYNYSQSELEAMANNLQVNYNGAILLAPPSPKYNCHAYAWHMSEGGGQVWIGYSLSTAEDIYWEDGSYIEVPESLATKVSYHENANHSAKRESDEWYISKWGAGPLVKHHPNSCPYNTSLPKKYYKRNSYIVGPTIPEAPSVYSVTNLPTGSSVAWSYSGNALTTATMTENSPAQNQCTINNSNKQYIKGILTAIVSRNGSVLDTLTKVIDTGVNFSGKYSQDSYYYTDLNWHYYGKSPTTFHSGDHFSLYKGPDITLTSNKFTGANISYLNGSVYGWSHNNNTVSFYFPYYANNPNSPAATTITGTNPNNYEVFQFSILGKKPIGIVHPIDKGGFSLTSTGRTYVISIGSGEMDSYIADDSWTLSVVNAITGLSKISATVSGSSYVFDTTGWESGVYVIQATVGNQTFTQKFSVK